MRPQDLPLHATAMRAVAIRDAPERVLVDQALTQNAQQIPRAARATVTQLMLEPCGDRTSRCASHPGRAARAGR